MNINWEVIEHVCISIAVVGAAITYIYKGVKFAKKPADDVMEKLDRDNRRLNALEDEICYNSKAIKILMRSELALLGHISTGNSSGEISKVEKEIQEFLISN